MVYDLDNPLQRTQFLARAEHLASKGGAVELTSKKPYSSKSNNYLHAIIGYFALPYGETIDYAKTEVFKKAANAELFWVERENDLRGRYRTLRSTSSLTQEEMATAIDRFRDWSAKEAGVYLPSPDDFEAMRQVEMEIQRNKQYL